MIRKLAKFLEVTASEEFLEKVADAVRFEAMKEKDGVRDLPKEVDEQLQGMPKVYRKGIAIRSVND